MFYHGNQFLRGSSVFQKMEISCKMKTNYFSYCIGFASFSFNFGALLKFWGNPEIQDGRHLPIMTCCHVKQRHHFHLQTSRGTCLDVLSIFQKRPYCHSIDAPEDKKKKKKNTRLDWVKPIAMARLHNELFDIC